MITRRTNDHLQERLVFSFDHNGLGTYPAAAVKATGLITCVTKANFADTDIVTISDGTVTKIFEFDTAGDGVTAGSVQVNISGATTAAQCATILALAINTALPQITATAVGDGTVTLSNDEPGTAGNVTITEVVANAGFLVSGMSGGLEADANTTSDRTIKLMKMPWRFRIDEVQYINPEGLAEDATNVFAIKLMNGATVVASLSSDSDQAGADNSIAADTPTSLTLSTTASDLVYAKNDTMSVFLDEGGTASLPPGRLVVIGRTV